MSAPTIPAPTLTRDERELLAAVHRWARSPLEAGSLWPQWVPSYLPGMWRRAVSGDKDETAEVWFGPNNDGRMRVLVRASRYGETSLDETVTPRSVVEAVRLLIVWGILPRTFLVWDDELAERAAVAR